MVCRTKLHNQLGVTVSFASLHNLIETLKSDRSNILLPFSQISRATAQILELVPSNNMFHMHAKF